MIVETEPVQRHSITGWCVDESQTHGSVPEDLDGGQLVTPQDFYESRKDITRTNITINLGREKSHQRRRAREWHSTWQRSWMGDQNGRPKSSEKTRKNFSSESLESDAHLSQFRPKFQASQVTITFALTLFLVVCRLHLYTNISAGEMQ